MLKNILERFLKTNESYLFFYKNEEDFIKGLMPFRLEFLKQSEYKSAKITDKNNLLFADDNLDKKQIRQIRIDFLKYLENILK